MFDKEESSSVVKLDSEQQKELARLLREQLPVTIMIYGMVKNIAYKKWPYLDIFVDEWPCYKATVIRGNSNMCGTSDGFNSKVVFFHGKDIDAIRKLARHPGVVDWTKELLFDVQPHVQEVLPTLLPEGAYLKELFGGQIFVVNPRTMKFSFNIEAPDLSVSELQDEDVPCISENWTMVPDMEPCISKLVNAKLPTICLRSQSGQPVAYALSFAYDVIAMLHVIPTHRRQGLAKVCISHMVQKKFKEEEFVGVQIRHDNEASRKLFSNCGFVPLPGANDYMVISYHPPK